MRRGCVCAGVLALLFAAPASAQTGPVAAKGDEFAPKPAGTVEKLQFYYGPTSSRIHPWMRGAFEVVE